MASISTSFKQNVSQALDWNVAYQYLKDFKPQEHSYIDDRIFQPQGYDKY